MTKALRPGMDTFDNPFVTNFDNFVKCDPLGHIVAGISRFSDYFSDLRFSDAKEKHSANN